MRNWTDPPAFYRFAVGCWFVYAGLVVVVIAVIAFIVVHFLGKVW